jgi:hypothetical protein
MFMIFILIQIKFDIDINNNELLKKYGNIRRGGKKLIVISSEQ